MFLMLKQRLVQLRIVISIWSACVMCDVMLQSRIIQSRKSVLDLWRWRYCTVPIQGKESLSERLVNARREAHRHFSRINIAATGKEACMHASQPFLLSNTGMMLSRTGTIALRGVRQASEQANHPNRQSSVETSQTRDGTKPRRRLPRSHVYIPAHETRLRDTRISFQSCGRPETVGRFKVLQYPQLILIITLWPSSTKRLDEKRLEPVTRESLVRKQSLPCR